MSNQAHLYDQVTGDLSTWMHETALNLAHDIAAGGPAPFSANASESDKLAYYRSKLFNVDGSANIANRNAEMERMGLPGYAKVMKALGKSAPAAPDNPDQAQIADEAIGGNT